jgi:hypothetical protein
MAKDSTKKTIVIYLVVIFFISPIFFCIPIYAEGSNYTDDELKTVIEALYNHRSTAFVTGDLSILQDDFDTSKRKGQWAQEHEIMRVKYLHDWASDRGMKFTNVTSTVRIKKVFQNTNPIKIALEETYKFDYIYSKDAQPVTNSFGVGIRHYLGLVNKDGKFLIAFDWYTDCFEDALKAYNSSIITIDTNKHPTLALNSRPREVDYAPAQGKYNRIKAVEYADKYCGAANGQGNNFKYNKKYGDYNGIGGDCTNFVSQVLGDKEAGGLRQDGRWHSSGRSGSSAWVNADGFKNYLTYSGKGMLIKRGTFKELALPTPVHPYGIIDQLDLGDLICYAKGSNMDHFAVITAWDSHGYPLVNSHTTDRYHVPWDLGWGDKNIYFNLIHIR